MPLRRQPMWRWSWGRHLGLRWDGSPRGGAAHHYLLSAEYCVSVLGLPYQRTSNWVAERIEIHLLIVLGARSLNQGVSMAGVPRKALGKDPSCLFWLLVAPGVPRLGVTSPPPILCLCLHTASPHSVSLCSLSWAQADPAWLHLEILN